VPSGSAGPPFVCIRDLGAGDSRGHGGFFFDAIVLPLLLRKVYEEKDPREEIVRGSNLDWVLVRSVVLNNRPAKGTMRAQTDISRIRGGTISRADAAKFVVAQMTHDCTTRH
jgi:hypothetical protein